MTAKHFNKHQRAIRKAHAHYVKHAKVLHAGGFFGDAWAKVKQLFHKHKDEAIKHVKGKVQEAKSYGKQLAKAKLEELKGHARRKAQQAQRFKAATQWIWDDLPRLGRECYSVTFHGLGERTKLIPTSNIAGNLFSELIGTHLESGSTVRRYR